jgi:hypothetical protein
MGVIRRYTRRDGGLRLPPLLFLLRSSNFGGQVELRRTSRLQPALRAAQIITAHVIGDPRLFIDACLNCPHDNRRIEDMRRAERPILCRRQNSSFNESKPLSRSCPPHRTPSSAVLVQHWGIERPHRDIWPHRRNRSQSGQCGPRVQLNGKLPVVNDPGRAKTGFHMTWTQPRHGTPALQRPIETRSSLIRSI